MTTPARTDTCAACRHFERRDPKKPWPIAGVSRSAEGQCDAPTVGSSKVDAWRPWRHGTDWCWQFKARAAPAAPQAAAQAPEPVAAALPAPDPETGLVARLTRAWRRIWKRRDA